MICKNKKCGASIPDGSLYCNFCGTPQKRDPKKKMYQRPDGLFEKVVTINKKQLHFRGKTEAEVTKKIVEYTGSREKGRLFTDIASDWKAEHWEHIADNTKKGYAGAYKQISEHWEGVFAKKIEPRDIDSFLKKCARSGMAQKTVRTRLLVLNLIFSKAVVDGELDENPAAYVKIPAGLPKKPREIPSQEEIQIVKQSVSATGGLFAFFILFTGCRRGEALAMTYGDLDFQEKLVHIDKSVYHVKNQPYLKQPKTQAGIRSVVLLDILAKELKPLKKNKEDLLFPNAQGGLMTETQFQRMWELYEQETGLAITPHQLRHAYATLLFEAGIDEKDAQDLMGHSSLAMTRDVYTHITKSRRSQTAEKLNEFTENSQYGTQTRIVSQLK